MAITKRIVEADDEPDVRDYFRRILPRLGHQVVVRRPVVSTAPSIRVRKRLKVGRVKALEKDSSNG
jgi:hypothetical protein